MLQTSFQSFCWVILQKFQVVQIVSLLSCLVACGPVLQADPPPTSLHQAASMQRYITDGQRANSEEYPATGAILIKMTSPGENDTAAFICSGTLIAPDVVLTAAHCDIAANSYPAQVTYYFSLNLNVTKFGQTSLELPPSTFEATQFVRHPKFDLPDTGNFDRELYDIGLLYLAKSVPLVKPALLIGKQAAANLREGSKVAMVGYGVRQMKPSSLGYNHGIKFYGISDLQEILPHALKISVGKPQPNSCSGDSGGAVYIQLSEQGSHILPIVGIVSYGDPFCAISTYATRIDTHLEWIYNTLDDACVQGQRVGCL